MNDPASGPLSPRPRRVSPPRWFDLRLLVGLALVLVSVLAGARIVSAAQRTYPAVSADRDLAAGTILAAGDLTTAQVRLPGRGAYLAGIEEAVGRRLSRPVSAGELVPAAAVVEVPERTTVTVPLEAGSAPDLRKGQRIELWASTDSCSSVVLLPDVAVQGVRTSDAGTFGGISGSGQDVVISVAPAAADRVMTALALKDVRLRAGILVGSRQRAEDQALADLGPCAAPMR